MKKYIITKRKNGERNATDISNCFDSSEFASYAREYIEGYSNDLTNEELDGIYNDALNNESVCYDNFTLSMEFRGEEA